MQDRNFFDELGIEVDQEEVRKQRAELQAKAEKIDYLIHAVFEQNEKGKELLAMWKEALILNSTAEPNMGYVEIGINEGQKRFIRQILLTIKRVESGNE